MRKLEFIGTVQANAVPQLIVPGWAELFVAPDDWPTHLAPGSLNIQVDADGYPEGFAEIGDAQGLKRLDEEVHRTLRESTDESENSREDARNLMLFEWAYELLRGGCAMTAPGN